METQVNGSTVTYETKYPEIIEACLKQDINLGDVFAQIQEIGGITKVGYPLLYLNGSEIPVDNDGDIEYDSLRVRVAKAYGTKALNAGQDGAQDILDKINKISEEMSEAIESDNEDGEGSEIKEAVESVALPV